MTRTISDTVTEISSLRHGIENAAWEEARGKLMAYLRLRGSCFGGDQEEYDALKDEIESFINRIDEGDIYHDSTDEITRLREENARLREELQKGFTAMRVFAKYRELEAEIETLRKAVKSAYYEGWQDNASIDDTEERLHAECACSEACAAIRETSK